MKYYSIFLAFIWILLFPAQAMSQVSFDIEYSDAQNFGFNDTTPVSVAGQNTGQTLGAQRRNALEHSLEQFSSMLHSDIPVHINAKFQNLGGSERSATLASAGPEWFLINFRNAPQLDMAYPSALANKISGMDLSNADENIADIILIINDDIDGSALGSSSFYYGFDQNPPRFDIDFITIVSHEIIHGLGFISAIDPVTGHSFGCDRDDCRTNDIGDIFSSFLARIIDNEPIHLLTMNQENRLESLSAAGEIIWNGPQTSTAATTLVAGTINGKPKMYTPDTIELGSSLSHTDFSIQPKELMQPAYASAQTLSPINLAMLADLGWGSTTDLQLHFQASQDSAQAARVLATITNAGHSSIGQASLELTATTGTLELIDEQALSSAGIDCNLLSSQQAKCVIANLAAGQMSQIEVNLKRNNTISDEILLIGTLLADALETKPDNNSQTIQALEALSPQTLETSNDTIVATPDQQQEAVETTSPNAVVVQTEGGALGGLSLLLLWTVLLRCRLGRHGKNLI